MLNGVCYSGFGFKILSEIPLPELPTVNIVGDDINVVIKMMDLAECWEASEKTNNYFIVNENSVMFRIPETAIFLVENGHKITVSPIGIVREDKIRLYLLGTCMGALLMQKKILPLHGSAIEINEMAYAIVGDSGAGKSTLASAFLKRGYALISDDVIPLSFNDRNIPIVIPAYPQQKLWQESLSAFGVETTNLRPIIERESKFAIPVTTQFSTQNLPLAGVFELVKTENEEINIQEINNLERLHKLFYHTYRNFLLAPAGLLEWHFAFTVQLLNHIQLYQLQRPVSQFTATDLTSLILKTINEGV